MFSNFQFFNFFSLFHSDPISKCTEGFDPDIYFSHFYERLKKVIEVNFKSVVQIIHKNKLSRKSFPISVSKMSLIFIF